MGKNESGKTNILEALYTLNPYVSRHESFNIDDYPRRHAADYTLRHAGSSAIVVTTLWVLEQDDLSIIESTLGPKALTSNEILIEKGYDNKSHWKINTDWSRVLSNAIKEIKLPRERAQQLKDKSTLEEVLSELTTTEGLSDQESMLLDHLNKINNLGSLENYVRNLLEGQLPKFVYFPDYAKMSGKVSVEKLLEDYANNNVTESDDIIIALLELAGSSVEELRGKTQYESLVARLEGISNSISAKIFSYWSQNRYLRATFGFRTALPNDEPPYNSGWIFDARLFNNRHLVSLPFEAQSAGFSWFFSFLVWFSFAERAYAKKLILLLDEPGLSLHGKAQKDLLRFFKEELGTKHQVIYTTHSPFMIDAEDIFSIRTVEDMVKRVQRNGEVIDEILGTKVGQRMLSRDQDTILPLQGILGYDIAQTMFVGPYVLVVEGPSEFGYIHWYSRQLIRKGRSGLDARWAVAPAEGASKISSFVTLFAGRGLKIAVLIDYHESQKAMVDKLEGSGLLPKGHIRKTSDYVSQDDADIEDLIGRKLYVHLVNEALNLTPQLRLPSNAQKGAPARVVKEVEAHCKTLPPGIPEFNHYDPVNYLMSMSDKEIDRLPAIEESLERFEALFSAINSLI